MKVAEHLTKHPKVAWVRYPGLKSDPQYAKNVKYLKGKGGPMVIFGMKASNPTEAGKGFIDNLKLISHVANVGDALPRHPPCHHHALPDERRAAGCRWVPAGDGPSLHRPRDH